ncbi:hypothetical protein TWF696_002824 [Orbilia brochopaga]|uniref:Uncharacterized protein n=1 Tax=Orbilia brochopaga TaxID=3140254 RepID=A0AAV9U243_9PEZI
MAPTVLQARQVLLYDDDYGWWYSDTAIIVKWTIGAVIFAVIIAYFAGGYIHARNRLSRGLPPLAYHRWMVRHQMAPEAYTGNAYGNGSRGYANYGGYAEPYQPPPPVYNPHNGPPPEYYPSNMQDIPLNASKTNPNQTLPGQQISGTTGGEASGSAAASAPRP